MQKKDNNNLLEPTFAVENYLDNLLHEVTKTAVSKKPIDLKTKVLHLPDFETDLLETDQENRTVEKSEHPLQEPEDISIVQTEREEAKHTAETSTYDYPVQCLMFTVNEHQLCIPLIDLGSVTPWEKQLTKLPHSPDWYLGLLKYRDKNVKVVDSARLLDIKPPQENNSQRHILVFDDEQWAITCDQIGDVILLQQEDIKWTNPESSNLSLGTVKQSLAILLDPAKIRKKLDGQNEDIGS